MDPLIGKKLSHFRILRRIGEGGMGVVYHARDARLQRDVALKVLPQGLIPSPQSRARFRREARSISRLNHPNIATIYDFDADQGTDFLAMELIQGETLADRIRRGPIPRVSAVEIGLQVAEALEFAHANRVIHRDLKPENVMLLASGLVKVLDFGLARRGKVPKSKMTGSTPRTRAGTTSQAMGTCGYSSPEQILGASQDARTDVFAFGCVLFECLAGKRAFGGETAEQVVEATLGHDPSWSALPAELPPRIRALLERCLEKDSSRRLPEIREARQELEAVLGTPRRFTSTRDSSPSAAHNLPALGTSFIGRDAEIAECEALLARTQFLTLTGLGGCGKTRLALSVAERLISECPDGVWFVDLIPIADAERVVPAILSAVGLREETGTPPIETLERSLRGKRLLLVLDNCEHQMDSCAHVARVLLRAGGGIRILATSRETLRVPEGLAFEVPALRIPESEDSNDVEALAEVESVRLFCDRAARTLRGFALSRRNAADVAEICRRLDGIPLAIELAASRVSVLAPKEIRSRLDHRFQLLGEERAEALSRHRTLRATMQWSYEQLTREEQALFRALSVFADGWTFESAMAVCGTDQDEFVVLDLMSRLRGKSLVVANPDVGGVPRNRYLETIREYAQERLEESGEGETVRERHLSYFLSLAEESVSRVTGPEQGAWLARLDAEHPNLAAALNYCFARKNAARALRFTGAIWRFWAARGHYAVGRRAVDEALRLDATREPTRARAETLAGGGALAFHVNDWTKGRAYCEESIEIFSKLGDVLGLARVLVTRGNHALGQSDYAAARSYYEQALARSREVGHRRGIGVALSNAGRAAELQGDFQSAVRLFEEGLAIFQEVGDLTPIALRLSSLGQVLLRIGEPERARARLVECLALVQELQDRPAGGFALERSASLLEAAGRAREAAVIVAAAESLSQDMGNPLTPRERSERDALIARLRSALGKEFERAWAEGRGLKLEGAIGKALACLDLNDPGGDRHEQLPAVPRAQTSTANLLEDVRGGDPRAVDRLVGRYLPILRRWAHGRLPGRARSLADTDDLVQVSLIRGLGRVQSFENRGTGAFLSYMRQILRNQIRDELRRGSSRADVSELPPDLPDGGASPLEAAIERESVERYEAALATLPEKQREAIVMRLEMGFTYREIAEMLGSPSEEAARISIRRSLARLKRHLPKPDPTSSA
jgi:RNA polymerase sigma factor (sigma-70 family)